MSKAEASKATGRLWCEIDTALEVALGYIPLDGDVERDAREEVEDAQRSLKALQSGWEALEAERDRLAEALRRIVNDLQAWESVGGSRSGHWPAMRLKAARAALGGRGA